MTIEDTRALGVGVQEVESDSRSGARAELTVDTLEELLEHWRFEGMEEEYERGANGELELKRVLLHDLDRSDGFGGRVGRVCASPAIDVCAGDAGKLRIQFNA